MKKMIFIVMAISISIITFAQEKGVAIQDVERIPMGDGTYTFRYSSGEKKHLEGKQRLILGRNEYLEAEFTNGLPTGIWEVYSNNKILEKSNYNKEGRRDGKQIIYMSDGETISEESYVKNGKIDGRYVKYYADGKIEKEQEYKEGVEDGIYRTYDKEGNILFDCQYKAGKEHGKQTKVYSSYTEISFFENGKHVGEYTKTLKNGIVEINGAYDKEGKKTGVWITRRKDDGITKSEESYKAGVLDGISKEFFTDGSVSKTTAYVNGKKNGPTISYDFSTGNIISEYSFVDNLREGPYKQYRYSQGDGKSLRNEGIYKKDKEISRKEYHENGKLRAVKEDKGKGMETLESYDEKGKLIKK